MKIGNLEVYGIIYKITNKVNGKVYIGQTTQPRGFKDRYCAKGEGIERVHGYYTFRGGRMGYANEYLMNSIDKYGFDSFEVSEIFDVAFSKLELDIKEVLYIQKYKSNNRMHGYNNHIGGIVTNIDSPFNNTRINKCSIPIYDKTNKICFNSYSEATKYYNLGGGVDKNRLNKFIKTKDGKVIFTSMDYYISNKKSIICLNDKKIFYSIASASKYYKIESTTIMRVCVGSVKTTSSNSEKIFFMYVNDYFEKLKNITSEENIKYILGNYNDYIEFGEVGTSNVNRLKDIKYKLNIIRIFEDYINDAVLKRKPKRDIVDYINNNSETDIVIEIRDLREYLKRGENSTHLNTKR